MFIAGFPKQTDQVELQTFFGQFGPIKKFVFGYNGRFAVIQFCERFVMTFCTYCAVNHMCNVCLITAFNFVLFSRESVEMCVSRILHFSRHRLRVKRQKVQDPPVKSKL